MISSDESAIKAWLHQRDQAAAAWLVNQHLSRVLHTRSSSAATSSEESHCAGRAEIDPKPLFQSQVE